MLKFQVTDINEIDEPLRAHYVREGDDGPFRLKLGLPENYSVEDVSGLKSALKKERDNNKTLTTRLAELEGESADSTRKLVQQNAQLLTELHAQRLTNVTNDAIHEAKGNPSLLRPLLERRVKVGEDGKPQVVDESGQPMLNPQGEPVSVRDFVLSLRDVPAYQGAFAGSGQSGAGTPPSSGNGAPAVTAHSRRSQMSVAERARLMQELGIDKYMEIPQ